MTDDAGVREASARFYAAVNEILDGNPAPMLRIWSSADDASYCDPRGEVQLGWAALEAYWQNAAAANADAPVRLSAVEQLLQVVVSGDLAYTVAREEVRREGDSAVLQTRATNVYRRENGEWRMIHRHADAPPAITQPGEPSATGEDATGEGATGEGGGAQTSRTSD